MTIKNRIELADFLTGTGHNEGVEVGVCDGRYSQVLLDANVNLFLYGVDPFVCYKEYNDYRRWKTVNGYHANAIELLKPYGDRYELMEMYSMDALSRFIDQSLDFVYIDGNHAYKYVKEDIEGWTKKVRSGGIVAGDDYSPDSPPHVGVVQAVNEYAKEHDITISLTTDPKQKNWWFVK